MSPCEGGSSTSSDTGSAPRTTPNPAPRREKTTDPRSSICYLIFGIETPRGRGQGLRPQHGGGLMVSSLRVGALLSCVLLAPSLLYAQAQASIAGSVRDTSGAVLPGVTVEASSPELIEKVRSAITDATGQYRIENLRPGTYAVTFALAGFSTVRREGIELAGAATFNVNAELKVGTLEETITVTGESPIV